MTCLNCGRGVGGLYDHISGLAYHCTAPTLCTLVAEVMRLREALREALHMGGLDMEPDEYCDCKTRCVNLANLNRLADWPTP